MWSYYITITLGCILHTHSAIALWSCSQDADCSSLAGSICDDGSCLCPPGTESVLGGTLCADVAPYHTSYCLEDHQCSRLVTSFECRRGGSEGGNCFCREGFHYYLGRCWNSIDYGEPCQRSEECMSPLRNPHSLTCNQTCDCAEGYYLRQRGECRKIGFVVGDGCVLDQDCHFPNAACNITTFRCYDTTAELQKTETPISMVKDLSMDLAYFDPSSRQHGAACSTLFPCPEPFVCSSGGCICPVGYYASSNGTVCLAELGSPSTPEQCVGLFAEVRNGICTCMANFFFEENMRDCVKASRRITDSCVTDLNCFTFGAASRCGPPQEPWYLRNCECVPELAVWDAERNMCRLFVGIGEECEADSDCLAGDLEIQCVRNVDGVGICTCPEGLAAVDGLCLTTGLALNDSCQASTECTATPHTICTDGRCSCDTRYLEVGDVCAPVINGTCLEDTDCVIDNTVCANTSNIHTCQCRQEFIEENERCWPVALGFESQCNVSSQCREILGVNSECSDGRCSCVDSFHHRDGGCWPITGLFEPCTRRSQCYLTGMSERVTCRNSQCQCEFDYPYSEELHTCISSAGSLLANTWILLMALIYICSL